MENFQDLCDCTDSANTWITGSVDNKGELNVW